MKRPSSRLARPAVMVASLFLFLVSAQAQTGQIQGTVVDDTGVPVAGARIRATQAASSPGTPAASSQAVSAANGGFELAGLTAGEWSLCVAAPGRELLDPCHVAPRPVPVLLDAGRSLSGVQLKLARGATLRVRIEDASALLEQPAAKAAGAHVTAGVWTPNGVFYPLVSGSRDATGATYSIIAPVDTGFHLGLTAAHVQIEDQDRKPVALSGQEIVPILIPRQETAKQVTFTVTALR